MRRIATTLIALAVGLGFLPIRSLGQGITGTIVGTVVDTSGGVIAGAQVTVKNIDTGISYNTVTGPEGFYTVPNLPPGQYDVRVQYAGFKTGVSSGNVVNVEENSRVDFTLSAGNVSQTVEVRAQTPMVDTTTSDIGSVITTTQVNDLPLNGRIFQQMLTLVPGTTPQAWGDQDENPACAGSTLGGGPGNGCYTSVNGFFFAGNNIMVDGVHDNEPANDYVNINVPFADIQEFKMETSTPTAEYGTFGGAVVNLTTKSGTNQFHGEGFDFLRNQALNARDHFALSKAPYSANQFGGAIGGPIKKDKLFFFGDFQDLVQTAGQTYTLNTPTEAERSGVLSDRISNGAGPITNANACAVIANANYAALGQAQVGVPCTASAAVTVPGTYDTVPAADISAISTAVLATSIIPAPNTTGASNYVVNTSNTERDPQFDARVDYAFSDKDRFFARESYLHRNYNSPAPGTDFMMGSNPNATNRNHSAVVAWDHILSGTASNEFRFGFNRYVTNDWVDSFTSGQSINNQLGILNGNLSGVPATYGIAEFTFQNINLSPTGDPGPIPNGLGRLADVYEYSEAFTKIWGRHTLKFGTDIQHIVGAVYNPQNDPRGCFSFTGAYTGNALGDFLVGGPGAYGCPGGGGVERDLFIEPPDVRTNFLGFFAQDDIRINPQFTLNLGFRYDIYTHPVSVHNTQSNFITLGPDAGLIQLATASNRGPNVVTYYGNIGPRVGFAYSPDRGKTAVRMGFGISYFPDNFGADTGTLERNYPELIQDNFLAFGANPACSNPSTPEFTSCGSLILANGLPGTATSGGNSAVYSPLVVPSASGGCVGPTGVTAPPGFVCPPAGQAVFDVEKNFRQDTAFSWNFSLQRQITPTMSFQAAYVGNEGSHLYHDYQLNQCDPPQSALPDAATMTFNNYPGCLPFPATVTSGPSAGSLFLSGVHARNSGGESRYNSLQFELQKRAAKGLTLIASYTWSKLMDNVDNPIDPYDTQLQLVGAGWKNGNYPQNFTISYVYDLPFGRGQRFLSNASAATQAVLGGWQASGVTTFRAGGALYVNGNGGLLPPGADTEPANFLCGAPGSSISNPHTRSEWFETNCFAEPPFGTFGGALTGNVYGPGLDNWDFSLSKSFALWSESKRFKFTANFFNIFNIINLNNPNTGCPQSAPGAICSGSNFGAITGDNGQPREIQLGFEFIF